MLLVPLLTICVPILLPNTKSIPLKKEYSAMKCNPNAEKTSFLLAKMYQPIDVNLTKINESKKKFCYIDKFKQDFNNVDSTLRKPRDAGSMVLQRTWMGLPASFVVTLVSVILLVLNIVLLLYILIKHGKFAKSKENQDLRIMDRIESDLKKPSQASSVSSALSTPRLSDGYPTSCSETEGNEMSSMHC